MLNARILFISIILQLKISLVKNKSIIKFNRCCLSSNNVKTLSQIWR